MSTTNLPNELSPFVGREHEIKQIRQHLSDPNQRLISIVGVGGVGKSQLAKRILAAAHNDFPDGGYYVDLSAITSADFLASAIADCLTLQFHTDAPQREQLVNSLKAKTLLLVLDRFEHLLPATNLLQTLLQQAPQLKILVTSREHLNLRSETVYTLDGLPYPATTPASLDGLLTYAAPRLFVERAQRFASDTWSVADCVAQITRLCQLVEGLPLALELAATWMRAFSCSEIVEMLQTNLDVLTANLRDLPERHHSIRVVFDQSWRLLNADEQTTFARLSTFHGGFTLKAAQQIAGATPTLLLSLIDKSLLYRDKNGNFNQHELVRRYAAERLHEDERAYRQLHAAHSRYYAEFLAQRQHDIETDRFREGLTDIHNDIQNVWAAWRWASTHGLSNDINTAARGYTLYHYLVGLWEDLERELVFAVDRFQSARPGSDEALALARLQINRAGNYINLDPDFAWHLLDVAADLLRDQTGQHPHDNGYILLLRGYLRFHAHEYDAALTYEQDAIRAFRQASNANFGIAYAMGLIGEIQSARGNLEQARIEHERLLEFATETRCQLYHVIVLPLLGRIYTRLHKYQQARALFLEALTEITAFPGALPLNWLLLGCAELFVSQRQPEHAAELVNVFMQAPSRDYRNLSVARDMLDKLAAQIAPELLHRYAEQAQRWAVADQLHASPLGVQPALLDYIRQLLLKLSFDAPRNNNAPQLSAREMQVLTLLANGLRQKEIASQLGVSENTIKTHAYNLRDKLGASNTAEAVLRARDLGLI